MAYKYQYSKMFSKNGAPIAAVKLSDLIGVSTPSTVGATSPWGFDSKDKTLAAIQKYFYNDIRVDGIGQFGIFKEGGGIIGAGTSADPIRIDKDWMNKRYIPAGNFPISQVGDPSDFILPISGSYFSVSYPYNGSRPFHSTAFLEGNGDLRFLHAVTNGEDIRPVYALWKSYRDMPVSTALITDVPYTPNGLSAGEFIQAVYPCSESAMIVDIFNGAGFVEHGLVILNGTLVSKFHTVIRLGKQVFTKLLGTAFTNALLGQVHSFGLPTAIVNGRVFIFTPAGIQPNGTNDSISYWGAEIVIAGNVGTLVPFTSTTATNCEGGVTTRNDHRFVLFKEWRSSDRSNKDAFWIIDDNISLFAGYVGVSPANYLTFGGVTADGKIIALTHHYHSCTAANSQAIKPVFYHLIDPINRTWEPAPAAWNRRWDITTDPSNNYLIVDRKGTIEYLGGHYWSSGHCMQLIGDGTRIGHRTPGGTDIGYVSIIYQSKEVNPLVGLDDEQFKTGIQQSTISLAGTPPTPTISGGTGYVLYDNLITARNPSNSGIQQAHIRNDLIGGETAKAYSVYVSDIDAAKQTYNGYALNNSRTDMGIKEAGAFVVVKDNTPYYHTGYFHRNQGNANNGTRTWGWDSSGTPKGNYYCSDEAYNAIDALKDTMPIPDGYTRVGVWNWNVFAPYPGVGAQRVVFKILITYEKDGDVTPSNPSGVEFWNYSIMGTMNCVTNVDSSNNCTLVSIDTSSADLTPTKYTQANVLGAESNQYSRMGGCCLIKPDGSWVVSFRGGGGAMGTPAGTNYNGHCTHMVNVDASNKVLWRTTTGYATTNVVQPATWHSKLGFGFVNEQYGLGTFYAFVPLTEKGVTDSSRPVTFLGTARPAAGFNLTVSAPITVYVRGTTKTLPIQTFDLRTVKPDARNSIFYIAIYAPANSTTALLDISLTPQVDTADRIYLGRIVTSDTEITEMTLEPVTRWESKRTSLEAVGSAILVTPGFPGESEDIAAISAGIDPTKWTGNVRFDRSAETVYITQDGTFFIQDKELAISRYGSYFQIYISGGTNGARGYLNGTEIWKGKGQSSNVVNRDALVREGRNTVHVVWGELHIKGPFLKMSS